MTQINTFANYTTGHNLQTLWEIRCGRTETKENSFQDIPIKVKKNSCAALGQRQCCQRQHFLANWEYISQWGCIRTKVTNWQSFSLILRITINTTKGYFKIYINTCFILLGFKSLKFDSNQAFLNQQSALELTWS